MPKLKNLLPNLFNKKQDHGRLETDALPVDETNNNLPPSEANTPTASAELTESVVRELSDPNYNSAALQQFPSPNQSSNSLTDVGAGALATLPNNGQLTAYNSQDSMALASPQSATLNTMNVHNAQQQVVFQFSNSKNVHIGNVHNFNSNLTATTNNINSGSAGSSRKSSTSCLDEFALTDSGKRLTPRKTTTVVSMMQSQEEPNRRLLDTVATHLGEGWKQVMRDLGQSDGQIEQAVIDHQMHGGIREVIYQLLLQWLRNADDGVATVGHLTSLLWERQHRDCVQRMKLVWKAEAKRKASS